MNKSVIYDNELRRLGFDQLLLKLKYECNELAASSLCFLRPERDTSEIANDAARVEIMIELLRHSGLAPLIEERKNHFLTGLAGRAGQPVTEASDPQVTVTGLLRDAHEKLGIAEALYLAHDTSSRLAAKHTRQAIGILMHAAQKMISEAQHREWETGEKTEVEYVGQ